MYRVRILNVLVVLAMVFSMASPAMAAAPAKPAAATGIDAIETLVEEHFEGAFPPAGWDSSHYTGCGPWLRNDDYDRTNLAGTGYAADADADACGSAMDASLWTPAFNLAAATSATLDFRAYYNFLGGDFFDVDVSTNGGSSWTNELHWDVDHMTTGGEAVSIPLDDYLGNASVIVRFRYVADSWDWYAIVDDVVITADIPTPVEFDPAAQTGAGCQGSEVVYHFSMLNQSGITDTFNLEASSDWPVVFEPASVVLVHGETTAVTATVSVPAYAFDGDADLATVTGAAASDDTLAGQATLNTIAGSQWLEVTDVNDPALWPAFASDGSSLFYFDGMDDNGGTTDQTQIYTPGLGWTAGSSLGEYAYGGVAGFDPDTALIYYAPGNSDVFVAYDPTLDAWNWLADRPAALRLGAGGVVDGTFIWAGGAAGYALPSQTVVYLYDIATDTWSEGTALSAAGFSASGYVVHDGLLYVGGSFLGSSLFYAYDPAADAWSQLADLPAEAGKVSPLMLSDGSDIYLVGGGLTSNTATNSTWRYDVAGDSWEQAAPLNNAVIGSGGGVLGSMLFTYGGGESIVEASAPAPHESTLAFCPPVDAAVVSGHVTNGVDDAPIEGAFVFVDASGLKAAGTTPAAYTDADGYYELTLAYPVTYTLGAAYGSFESAYADVQVPSADPVTQDFVLGPAVVEADPTSFDVTLMWGETEDLTLTVGNAGYSALDFELIESNGGYISPAWFEYLEAPQASGEGFEQVDVDIFNANRESRELAEGVIFKGGGEPPKATRPSHYIYHAPGETDADPSILVYADDPDHTPTSVELGLQELGLSYTFFGYDDTGNNLDAWLAALTGGTWDLVIMIEDNWARVAADDYTALNNHINAGGKAIAFSWAVYYDAAHSSHALWNTMGVSYASYTTSAPTYWWNPTHQLFTRPESVPAFTSPEPYAYTDVVKMNVLASATALGGFTAAPSAGEAGIVLRNDGATIYKGVGDTILSSDLDADGTRDAAEWYTNAVAMLLGLGGGGDIAWLSESPITATLSAATDLPVTLTFDALTELALGTYTGTLTLASNDPANPEIAMPVQLTVVANPDAALLEGIVTTDRPGGPLEFATVDVESESGFTATATTDADGYYGLQILPADLGVFTVTASAADYVTQFVTTTVVSGTNVQDFELIFDGPWMIVEPEFISETVMWGEWVTSTFMITNVGIADLDFEVYDWSEIAFDDFEADDGGYTLFTWAGTNTWEWGIPTQGPAGDGNVWATSLAGDYPNSSDACIASPVYDLSGYMGGAVELDQFIDVESGWDEAYILVTDNGVDWYYVTGWSGTATDWFHYGFTFPGWLATAQFQVAFCVYSDGSVVYDGYAVDNVHVMGIPAWKWEDHNFGTVSPDSNDLVEVTLDSFYVPGPGVYTAYEEVLGDDPFNPRETVDVTFTVLPNPDAARLSGVVTANRTPDGEDMPLAGALVEVFDAGYVNYWSTYTDEAGFYEMYFFPWLTGTYTVSAWAPDYTYEEVTVTLDNGDDIVQDFALGLLSPYLNADPEAINETLAWGAAVDVPVVLSNDLPATEALNVELSELGGSYTPPVIETVSVNVPASSKTDAAAPEGSMALNGASGGSRELNVDIRLDALALGTIEVGLFSYDALVDPSYVAQLVAVLEAYPDLNVTVMDIPGTLALADLEPYDVIFVGANYSSGSWAADQFGDVFADYVEAGGGVIMIPYSFFSGNNGGTYWKLGGRFETEFAPVSYAPYATYDGFEEMGFYDSGHPIMAGWDPMFNWVEDYNSSMTGLSPANGGVPVAFWDTGTYYIVANEYAVAFNQVLGDGADWAGDVPMLLHNAILFLAPVDVPWLSESATSFVIDVAMSDTFTATLDAGVVNQPGTYNAWLWLDNNDVLQQGAYIPVEMVVEADPNMGQLIVDVTMDRHANGLGLPAAGASVVLSSAAGVRELTANADGQATYYYTQAELGAGLDIDVTASLPGYQVAADMVTLHSAEVLTTALELRLMEPWAFVSPDALEATVLAGETFSMPVTVENFGLADLTINLLEFPATVTMPTAAGYQPAGLAPMVVDNSAQVIEQDLVEELAANGSADMWVRLRGGADLSAASSFADKTSRVSYVAYSLQAVAEASQVNVINYLERHGLSFQPYWIVNAVLVYDATQADLAALRALPEVIEMRGRFEAPMDIYTVVPPIELVEYTVVDSPNWSGTAWGLEFTGADQVWSQFGVTGEGMVVANIDTGVQWDHPALQEQFRGWDGTTADGNYNWATPGGNPCGDESLPCDWGGHGSHTMGTMVGDDGVAGDAGHRTGMAPGATWMACMGCDTAPNSCSDAALTGCAEWILLPTDLNGENPDPAMAPDIVNNSWGGGHGDDWYRTFVQNWVAAGIFPSFSAGNAGPGCATAGSPGDNPESFASGMHDIAGVIDSGSSRGPGGFGDNLKPDLAAPGVSICSTIPGDAYTCGYSGTSMAAPHTSGAVALLWSGNPYLAGDIDATRDLLTSTANPNVPDEGNCGKPADVTGIVPNYTYGWGYLDVFAAMEEAMVYDIPWLILDPVTGTVAADSSLVVDVTFDATDLSAGVYTGTVRVLHNDPLVGNIDLPVTLTVVSYDLLLAPESDALTGNPTEMVTYTLTITNLGTFADTFDLEADGVWTATLPATVGPLDAGASETFEVVVEIPVTAHGGEFDETTVTATSQGNPAMADSSLLTTTVGEQPVNLVVTKSFEAEGDRVLPGSLVTYTITIENAGHDSVDAELVDLIPAMTAYVVDSATNGLTYVDPGNRVEWAGTIADGETVTLTYVVVVDEAALGETITNTATVTVGETEYEAEVSFVVSNYVLFLPISFK